MKKFIFESRLILIISFILFIFFSIFGVILVTPKTINYTIVDIMPGQSARSIAITLEKQGVINNANVFYVLSRLTGNDKKLKQGAYLFRGKLNILEALHKIVSGEILVQKITIPEGTSMFKTLRIICDSKVGNYDSLYQLCHDKSFIQQITGFNVATLEGFLYPDTYVLNFKTSDKEILETLVLNFKKKMQANQIDMTNQDFFYKTLKLASIVEKEAVFSNEKPLIASVYQNRLDKGMLLQADPTSTYHLEESGIHKSSLTYRDVRQDTPHNTYVHKGLPPTPICTPSVSAIQAALKPAQTDYLFFFANEDGHHIFTLSYAEHLKKQRIQKSS